MATNEPFRFRLGVGLMLHEDYAKLLPNDDIAFYYGSEVADDEGAWCFQATIGTFTRVFTRDDLGPIDQEDCAQNLLMGIGLFIKRFGVAPGLGSFHT